MLSLLSCCCLPPSDFPLWKWSYSDIFHLFTSYSLSGSVWVIVCTCHSGKTTPRPTSQRLLVLMSVVVVAVEHCFSLKHSPSWMQHKWRSPELSPPPGCCSASRSPCPTPTGTGGHMDLDLTLSLSPFKKPFWLHDLLGQWFPMLLLFIWILYCITCSDCLSQLHVHHYPLVLGCFHSNGPVKPKLQRSPIE